MVLSMIPGYSTHGSRMNPEVKLPSLPGGRAKLQFPFQQHRTGLHDIGCGQGRECGHEPRQGVGLDIQVGTPLWKGELSPYAC
mmetsp:Transcript_71208/g.148564  ORF Transcript_71208/g.148564 Transcript_71208/m.148564 type:complete len:83 (+) Transcript_71208:4406-4654(+)